MAVIKCKQVREQPDAALAEKLATYEREFNAEKGTVKNGGRSSNPGKIKELRRTISRIKTIMHERTLLLAPGGHARKSVHGKTAAKASETKNEVKRIA